MWKRADFICFGNVAVDLIQSVIFFCWEVYIFVEFRQDRFQVGMIVVPCRYHNAVWVGRLELSNGKV